MFSLLVYICIVVGGDIDQFNQTNFLWMHNAKTHISGVISHGLVYFNSLNECECIYCRASVYARCVCVCVCVLYCTSSLLLPVHHHCYYHTVDHASILSTLHPLWKWKQLHSLRSYSVTDPAFRSCYSSRTSHTF